jgi:hypothetical protein
MSNQKYKEQPGASNSEASSGNQSRKSQKRWKHELPAFLDAASSVSAAAYGARRLPELKALYQQLQATSGVQRDYIDEALVSGGHKTSTRHMRRRTTSYNSRKRHRYPDGISGAASIIPNSKPVSTSRKARRKPAFLRQEHSTWHHGSLAAVISEERGNEEDANSSQHETDADNKIEPKIHWLPTHLWHSKRFHMYDMFGWKVPLHHNGRGVRSIERLLQQEGRTTLQDTTWRMQPIILKQTDTTGSIKELIDAMTKLCPAFLPSSQAESIMNGSSWGEGILHEPGAFPSKAIGPAKWWIRTRDNDGKKVHELHLFLHPSIRSQVQDILLELFIETDVASTATVLDGGMACFQLRGVSASQTLGTALHISEKDALTGINAHGCITKATIDFKKGGSNATAPIMLMQGQSVPAPLEPFGLQGSEVLLVRCKKSHSDGHHTEDGWDLICSVSAAHAIFLALAMHCIPIGYAEECSLGLSNGNTVFPMMFPDCGSGQSYWQGHSYDDWKLLREAIECGIGRVVVRKTSLKDFCEQLERIASCSKEVGAATGGQTTDIVVVRGMFGHPFADLLQQCGRVPEKETSSQSRRRYRRKRQIDPGVIRLACRIPGEETTQRLNRAMALSQSLSLDALIQCRIEVCGRGTLQVGDSIYGCSTDENNATTLLPDTVALGMVLNGSFSGGSVHGCGLVGATRLLAFLARCRHPAMAVGTRGSGLLLVVELGRDSGKEHVSYRCKGTLSLEL